MASEWISVKDRLPETGRKCLVVWSGCVQDIAYRRVGIGYACCGGYEWEPPIDLGYDAIPDAEVTHWQPQPAPPEDSNG